MCTIVRCHNVQKKASLMKLISILFHSEMPLKYKKPRCLIIYCVIGWFNIEKALRNLGASVNLLPYFVYKQVGHGELKQTLVTL